MKRLLALDTTTEACSAALWSKGGIVSDRFVVEPRGHTQRLLPMIDSLLADAGWTLSDLDGIACTRGPGSFTGVRVGVSAAQGLAFAADLPVMALSTLAVLAWQGRALAPQYERWQVAMDARMGEIYTAAWQVDPQGLTELEPEALMAPDQLQVRSADTACGRIGAGWALPPLDRWGSTVAENLPSARYAATLAGLLAARDPSIWGTPDQLQPVYLRDRVT